MSEVRLALWVNSWPWSPKVLPSVLSGLTGWRQGRTPWGEKGSCRAEAGRVWRREGLEGTNPWWCRGQLRRSVVHAARRFLSSYRVHGGRAGHAGLSWESGVGVSQAGTSPSFAFETHLNPDKTKFTPASGNKIGLISLWPINRIRQSSLLTPQRVSGPQAGTCPSMLTGPSPAQSSELSL